jgi:hypothetical protein
VTKYLTGVHNEAAAAAAADRPIGLLIQPGTRSYVKHLDRYQGFAVDNGCFSPASYVGDDAWLEWVDTLPRDGCLFVVIPDVVCDPVATWARFQALAPLVRAMGFPVALAAQDGIESMPGLYDMLDAADVVFIGGSTEWKESAAAMAVAAEAKALGKRVHMGRVNSGRRYRLAAAHDIDTVDGTFLAFGPSVNLPRLCSWLDDNAAATQLAMVA